MAGLSCTCGLGSATDGGASVTTGALSGTNDS